MNCTQHHWNSIFGVFVVYSWWSYLIFRFASLGVEIWIPFKSRSHGNEVYFPILRRPVTPSSTGVLNRLISLCSNQIPLNSSWSERATLLTHGSVRNWSRTWQSIKINYPSANKSSIEARFSLTPTILVGFLWIVETQYWDNNRFQGTMALSGIWQTRDVYNTLSIAIQIYTLDVDSS